MGAQISWLATSSNVHKPNDKHDSELSDDDTGIVSPVLPTLPSKVKSSKVHICGDGSVTPLLALYILHCMIFYSISGTEIFLSGKILAVVVDLLSL